MINILAQVTAVLLMLISIAGLVVSFLLSTQIVPWAVVVLVSYVLWRVEGLHRKLRNITGVMEV